jgi:hypothetical protein
MRRGETPVRVAFLVGVAAATLVSVVVVAGVSTAAVTTTTLAESDPPSAAVGSTPPAASSPVDRETSPNVSSTLRGLVEADDREAFAAAHDIDLRDGRVVVVVELRGRSTVPDGYEVRVQQTATVGGETVVQARVPVDEVVPLSEEPGVAYVRLPDRAVAAGSPSTKAASKDAPTAAPDAGLDARDTDSRPATQYTDVLVFVVAVGVAVVAVGLYGRSRR